MRMGMARGSNSSAHKLGWTRSGSDTECAVGHLECPGLRW